MWKGAGELECVPNGCPKLPQPHHGTFHSLPAGVVQLNCDKGKVRGYYSRNTLLPLGILKSITDT